MPAITQLMLLLVGLIVGLAIARVLDDKSHGRRKRNDDEVRKKENLKKVLKLLRYHDRLTNDDVEHLLHVSDITAWRYLEQLEREGFINQVGKTGRTVYYRKN